MRDMGLNQRLATPRPRVLFVFPFGVVGARGVFLEVRRIYVHADVCFLAFQGLARSHQDVGFLCFGLCKGIRRAAQKSEVFK